MKEGMITMLSLLPLILLAAAPVPDRPDLEGRVVTSDGAPVTGAHVLIATAAVRQGTSPLCPSCYADCSKRALTGSSGGFRIAALDPEQIFNVLVVADGFWPTFARKVDPARGPLEVTLKRQDLATLDPRRILRGVVLGPDGQPLVGASLLAQHFRTEAFSGFGPDIFDPVAVTNLRGEFVLTSKSPIEDVDLRIEGNGVATRIVPGRRPEANPPPIRMTAGATLTGRVVRDGRPVPGAAVGLVQVDRSAQSFLGDRSIGTDADGRFTFLNVHPDDDYFVYGLMGTLKDNGAAPARQIHVSGEGTTANAGDLDAVAGHTIRGRVLLSDGKNIPPKTRLLIGREDAWDSQRIELGPDGGFTITGLPTERYSLTVSVKGYRVSPRNHSADSQNRGSLVGTIDQDIDGLKILLEPGAD
jgi:hypothetical protein